jgi:hypothetical protein
MAKNPVRAWSLALLTYLFSGLALVWANPDIPVMTWTPRSDWINVKTAPYHATGDGTTDDTAAIQAALTKAGEPKSLTPTVYFPPGTYKITATLDWQGTNDWKGRGIHGAALIGCGRSTIIKWAGPGGAAMFWTKGATTARYIGLAWDGDNIASCAYEAASPNTYEYSCRHENESFRNFTAPGNYIPGDTVPAAAIIGGLPIEGNSPDAEIMIWNCLFVNCTNGVIVSQDPKVFNNYLWEIKGCEFESCGTGIYNVHGRFAALDCHFQDSKEADFSCNPSTKPCIRRCTSVGSNCFYQSYLNKSVGAVLIQDCWVDSWKNPEGAIQSGNIGPCEILDCVFTNPPSGGAKNPRNSPIVAMNVAAAPSYFTVSNNSCPTISTENLVNMGPNPGSNLITIPAGKVPAAIPTRGSANLTFLHTAEQDDSTHILDVTLDPYKADTTGLTEAASAIQMAIDDARKANNGTVVYLPVGKYKISSTIKVTGSNYTIQGAGVRSILDWGGPDQGTFFDVASPQKLSMEQFQCNYDGKKLKDVTAINQTAAGPCTMNYDGIYYNQSGSAMHTPNGTGLKLDSLPAGSRVTAGELNLALTIHDCGPAEILFNYSIGGRIIVDGATQPKTGFLGIINSENGTGVAGPDSWNIFINDNQDFVMGDYYQEQGHNCIKIAGGAGREPGHVTICGIKQQYYNQGGAYAVVDIDNYAGRFYYGQVNFANYSKDNKGIDAVNPTVFIQTGTNPCNLILDSVSYIAASPIVFKLDKGAKLIQLNNVQSFQPPKLINVQPEGWGAATAQALDDERLLGQYDLDWNYGINKAATSLSK